MIDWCLNSFGFKNLMLKYVSVGPKIREMSPKTKDKVREDVQEAMAEKEEQGKSKRRLISK